MNRIVQKCCDETTINTSGSGVFFIRMDFAIIFGFELIGNFDRLVSALSSLFIGMGHVEEPFYTVHLHIFRSGLHDGQAFNATNPAARGFARSFPS